MSVLIKIHALFWEDELVIAHKSGLFYLLSAKYLWRLCISELARLRLIENGLTGMNLAHSFINAI